MTKEEFFAQPTLRSETITVPGLGRLVIRELSLAERLKAERLAREDKAPSWMAVLVAAATATEDGKPFFSPEDAHAIDKMPASKVFPLTSRVSELNELAPDEEADAAKN